MNLDTGVKVENKSDYEEALPDASLLQGELSLAEQFRARFIEVVLSRNLAPIHSEFNSQFNGSAEKYLERVNCLAGEYLRRVVDIDQKSAVEWLVSDFYEDPHSKLLTGIFCLTTLFSGSCRFTLSKMSEDIENIKKVRSNPIGKQIVEKLGSVGDPGFIVNEILGDPTWNQKHSMEPQILAAAVAIVGMRIHHFLKTRSDQKKFDNIEKLAELASQLVALGQKSGGDDCAFNIATGILHDYMPEAVTTKGEDNDSVIHKLDHLVNATFESGDLGILLRCAEQNISVHRNVPAPLHGILRNAPLRDFLGHMQVRTLLDHWNSSKIPVTAHLAFKNLLLSVPSEKREDLFELILAEPDLLSGAGVEMVSEGKLSDFIFGIGNDHWSHNPREFLLDTFIELQKGMGGALRMVEPHTALDSIMICKEHLEDLGLSKALYEYLITGVFSTHRARFNTALSKIRDESVDTISNLDRMRLFLEGAHGLGDDMLKRTPVVQYVMNFLSLSPEKLEILRDAKAEPQVIAKYVFNKGRVPRNETVPTKAIETIISEPKTESHSSIKGGTDDQILLSDLTNKLSRVTANRLERAIKAHSKLESVILSDLTALKDTPFFVPLVSNEATFRSYLQVLEEGDDEIRKLLKDSAQNLDRSKPINALGMISKIIKSKEVYLAPYVQSVEREVELQNVPVERINRVFIVAYQMPNTVVTTIENLAENSRFGFEVIFCNARAADDLDPRIGTQRGDYSVLIKTCVGHTVSKPWRQKMRDERIPYLSLPNHSLSEIMALIRAVKSHNEQRDE